MGKLSGKTALVTGAARGLGRAYALRLAMLGANVGVVDIDLHSYREYSSEASELTADTVVDEIRSMGVASAGVEADVGDAGQARDAIRRVASELGDITILVANAGGGLGSLQDGVASRLSLDLLQRVVQRNFYATVCTVSAVVPMMRKRGTGKIVTVASHGGLQANHDGSYAHYGAAKAAVIHYTWSLAQELGPDGIHVNCIAPGFISTGRLSTAFNSVGVDKFLRNVAMRRFGTPEECANVIEFLTTDLSDYVTGAVIEVNGGSTRRMVIE